MKNYKTPGSDELNVEFYKIFWNSIKELVFENFVYAYDLGEQSIDQKMRYYKSNPQEG